MTERVSTAQRSHTTKRVFLTGATGSMGLAAARALIAAGHRVVGTTRQGAAALKDLGATPVQVDLFDERALRDAMRGADVIVHFATSIPRGFSATRRRAWQINDRLRCEGTAILISAAESTGVRRFIFESLALAYPDRGDSWIDESEELFPPSAVMGTVLEAERMLAEFEGRGGEAVSLRFGRLYGPGRASSDLIEAVRKRWMPVIESGNNFFSNIHAEDVGSAVAAAINVAPGIYNIVDDEPVTQRVLLEAVASSLGVPPPRHLPQGVARFMLGHVARVMTVSQRVSNRRFREATKWRPLYPSAVDGWTSVAEGFVAEVAAA